MADGGTRSLNQVGYREVERDFFARRSLRRHARTWSVLAFGVGAVIAGEFAGWNPGLLEGGFGGLLVATIVTGVMYVTLCASLAEMAAAMPFAGNAYAYSRAALGAWGGFLAGLTQVAAMILGSAVFVVQIGDAITPAMEKLIGFTLPPPVWWALLYALFGWVNIYGVELFFRVALTLCVAALAVLGLYWFDALSFFELHLALNAPVHTGGTLWLPNGLVSVAWALPFAVWFYVNIEQVPLAAEETHQPERNLPRALLWGMAVLIVAALLTLILNSGVPPGAAEIGASTEPLLVAFRSILVFHVSYYILPLLFIVGLVASFHTSIYAFSRGLYVLSRAGYIPSELSLTHARRQTPHYAILVGIALAYAIAVVIYLSPGDGAVAIVMINMSVFAALLSYIFTMVSYVILARDYPDMKRPYISPFGASGAIVALLIAGVAVLLLFANPAYRAGLYGCGVLLLGGIAYFTLRRRYRLIRAPEEVFALELAATKPQRAAVAARPAVGE